MAKRKSDEIKGNTAKRAKLTTLAPETKLINRYPGRKFDIKEDSKIEVVLNKSKNPDLQSYTLKLDDCELRGFNFVGEVIYHGPNDKENTRYFAVKAILPILSTLNDKEDGIRVGFKLKEEHRQYLLDYGYTADTIDTQMGIHRLFLLVSFIMTFK